ncbi:hypothetical protein KQH27_01020 [bacterium]|nr:hypothetical protein [bacterium]
MAVIIYEIIDNALNTIINGALNFTFPIKHLKPNLMDDRIFSLRNTIGNTYIVSKLMAKEAISSIMLMSLNISLIKTTGIFNNKDAQKYLNQYFIKTSFQSFVFPVINISTN